MKMVVLDPALSNVFQQFLIIPHLFRRTGRVVVDHGQDQCLVEFGLRVLRQGFEGLLEGTALIQDRNDNDIPVTPKSLKGFDRPRPGISFEVFANGPIHGNRVREMDHWVRTTDKH
jgi:hypothetical protein